MTFFQHLRYCFAVCIAGIAFNSFGQSEITINVDSASTVIPKEIFGVEMGRLGRQWNNGVFVGTNALFPRVHGMRQDVIDAFVECGVGSIAWPGGCTSLSYDWSTYKDPVTPEGFEFGVGAKKFIEFCQLTGAEPVIVGKGLESAAASNFEFASYIIDSLQYPLKWFKIGFQAWGCGGNQRADGYMSNYTANYEMLKSLKGKPNGRYLNIISSAGAMEGDVSWVKKYMSGTFGTTVDGLEFTDYTYYPNTISSVNPTQIDYLTIMSDILSADFGKHLINQLLPEMNSADPEKRVKIVLDGWGNWLTDRLNGDEWMQGNTVMDAISAGLHLNMMLGQADRINVACMAQGVSVLQSLINIHPESKLMVKTPTFYIFKLLKPHHTDNAQLVPVIAKTIKTLEVNNTQIPVLNAAASVNNSGAVNISIANIDLSAQQQVVATLNSQLSYKILSAEIVTGSSHTSTNDFGVAEQVNIKTLDESNYSIQGHTLNVNLPPKSVVMIQLIPLAPEGGDVTKSFQSTGLLNNHPESISVKAGAKGSVVIKSILNTEKTVTVSLYRADGRALVKNVKLDLHRGNSNPGFNVNSNGVYFVKIIGKDVNFSEKIIIER